MKQTLRHVYSGVPLAEIELLNLEQARAQIDAAAQHFARRGALPMSQRVAALLRFKTLMQENKQELIRTSIAEGAKPLVDTEVEFARALGGVDFCLQALGNLCGEQIPMGMTAPGQGHLAFTRREALGVILAYGAFNHPINLFVHQVLPALALGAPIVYKPSEKTPLVARAMADLVRQAGFGALDLQVLHCEQDVAAELVASPQIQYFGFIGAASVGWKLRSRVAPGVRVGLEHGGMAPLILGAGQDCAALAPGIAKAATYHSGQVCISTQHVFVPAAQKEELIKQLKQQFAQIVWGDPELPSTQIGPVIHPSALERIDGLVQDARSCGARIHCGGQAQAPFYLPTLISDLPPAARLWQEEVFGPVLCVHGYEDLSAVVEQINAWPFAFQASYFGNDLAQAMEMAATLRSATVLINEHTVFRTDWMPFGGWKESGLGSGGFPRTLQEYSAEKLIVLRHPSFA